MIAKQTVYLTEDRKNAVPEGDKDARFLLVRAGHEVNEAELEKYEGAQDLVTTESKVKPEPPREIPPPNFKKFGKDAEQERQFPDNGKKEPAPAKKVAKPRRKK